VTFTGGPAGLSSTKVRGAAGDELRGRSAAFVVSDLSR
jgi:hypothetical protein